MKKVLSVILLVVLCMTLVACGEPDAPEGYKLVSDKDESYRFYAPTTWNLNNSNGISCVYYSSDDPSMVLISKYLPDADQSGITALWEIMENSYKTTYTNYEFVSKETTTMGGQNAEAYTFTATIGTVNYKVKQIISGHGNYFYSMTYMSSPENFDSHLEALTGMAGVFEFK